MEAIPYSDAKLRRILSSVRTIAVVGASSNWNRPSYFVMKYLQRKGYRVIPVNPGNAGKDLLGERVYANLRDIPDKVDMVNVFRASKSVGPIMEDAIAVGIKVVWMQLGVRNDEAAAQGEVAGIEVIMNRCPKIEFGRLGGELSWGGVNSGIIRKKPAQAPTDRKTRPRDLPAVNIQYGFETCAIHAGAAPDPSTGARGTPIYQTTAYVFDDVEHAASLFNLHNFGFLYSRITNPTVSVLEERVASLEGGRAAVAAASGHAAQFLIFATMLEPGDEFVASNKLYGGSLTQFSLSFKKLGWHCHFVDPTDPENFRRALTPKCKAIFIESLANPGGIISDISAIADVAHSAGLPLIVDNTLATPYLCRPIEWGADLVVHSTTKFLGGHGNAMGGVIVESGKFDWTQGGKFPCMTEPEPAYHGLRFYENFGDFAFTTKARAVALRDYGPAMAPMNAFLTITGIETLHLRMERHCSNAQAVAEYLVKDTRVAWVSYAGLETSPFRKLASKYLPKGSGAVFTFGVKGGYEMGCKLVESVSLFSHLANVGDTRSLILHPASTTHRQLSDEQRESAGAGADVIRLSIGLETAADLIADLDRAMGSEKEQNGS
ncbi:Putative cys/Met metabolism, pyridoxal phosphate-dependent enzyme, coA-binding protein [Septoria linicola]|uniref:Cys/Met metabolism, pyridoxal phosphate-dependent enzyme, coA-binding protein n=1 Tax=Septoria linicola TaxID=215465 RepID=A0A9Q9EMM6_9PEZI|nr:Putative cys/Met metabolism, pyridoxal phosphate-dependent enzyme, coA-binding protein [Septoria linicola]